MPRDWWDSSTKVLLQKCVSMKSDILCAMVSYYQITQVLKFWSSELPAKIVDPMIDFRKLFAKPRRNVDNLFFPPLPPFENINWWWWLGGGEVWREVCLHLWGLQGKTEKLKNSEFMLFVITPVLIGRGDRVQQQIIWEWENPRCDRDRLQPHQVGKGNNTCTLMRAPYILPLSDCWTLFTARRKRQSMWSPNSGWSRPWTGSATGSWRTTFTRCLEKHVINLVGTFFLPFRRGKTRQDLQKVRVRPSAPWKV